MTSGWESVVSEKTSGFWSPCRWIAFHPHFLAVAAALVTAAKERRFVSPVEDFPDDEVEFSRLGSRPKDPKDFVEGASDLKDAVLMLAGLGGSELWTGLLPGFETLSEG